jgi:hypothetical protein
MFDCTDSARVGFQFPASRSYRRNRRPLTLTRVVLPVLTKLMFKGISEYFEDLVARIDTPVIAIVEIFFYNQLVFDIPRFLQFASRTELFASFKRAEVYLGFAAAYLILQPDPPERRNPLTNRFLYVEISCRGIDWQISGLSQISSQFSLFFSNVEQLHINFQMYNPLSQNDMDCIQWLELVQPFVAVQRLHIQGRLVTSFVPALQQLTGDRVMEVLPALRHISISLHGTDVISARKSLRPFITARQLINHPVTVVL